MSKKQVTYILVLSIFLSLAINIFFGRYLGAKISTIPLLNRWKILSPQAPIVINTREEVRVSDTADVIKVVSLSRPRLSGIIAVNGGETLLIGGAVNLTSDGLFLTSKAVLTGVKLENLYIKLDDGALAPVASIVSDPASNLVVLKASLRNIQVANLGTSRTLSAGDRIIFLAQTLKNFSPVFQSSFVAKNQLSDFTAIMDSDLPHQTFGAQGTGALLAGQAIENMSGDVVGLWDGSNIISSDVMKDFVDSYLSSGGKLQRPGYGFQFRNVSAAEAKLQNVPFGAKITKVVSLSPAQKGGLKENDTITAINDASLTEDNPLGNYLQKYKPGDKIKFSVSRDKSKIDVYVIASELK
jgi:serine protease Do